MQSRGEGGYASLFYISIKLWKMLSAQIGLYQNILKIQELESPEGFC